MTLPCYRVPSLHSTLALCAALTGSACSTDDLPESNLGNTNDPITVAPEELAERSSVFGGNGVDPFLIGNWVGYAEDLFEPPDADGQRPRYVFPSGSSEIFLTLGVDPPYPYGEIRFGSLAAPVPQAGVPLGMNDYFAEAAQFADFPLAPVEGFAYALYPAQPRFRREKDDRWEEAVGMNYSRGPAFADWCAIQPSVGDSCVGAAISGFSGNGEYCDLHLLDGSLQEVDCNLQALCNWPVHPCNCDASGCVLKPVERPTVEESLWIAREGDQLVALASGRFQYPELGYQMPIGVIRFDRVEP